MTKRYEVVQDFTDGTGGKVYRVGDKYPSNKKKERLDELLGDRHPHHKGPIIKEVIDKE